MKRYTGWGYKGMPFTSEQFKNSFIKKNIKGLSYKRYISNYTELAHKGSDLIHGYIK